MKIQYTSFNKTLNSSGIKSPVKGHKLAEWIKKEKPSFCCLQEIHLTFKDRHYFRVKGWMEKLFEEASVAILISDTTDFKLKLISSNKEGNFIPIKGTIDQGFL